jgi:hypothetical protein
LKIPRTASVQNRYQFIKWPSDQRKREIKQGFHESGGFPGVIECVNGTHVRITAPNVDEPSFVNRKGYHSLNVQATRAPITFAISVYRQRKEQKMKEIRQALNLN